MNKNELEGQWRQVTGHLTSAWGAASHDLGKRLSGNGKRLLGVLQSRFGALEEQAAKDKASWINRAPANTAAETTGGGL